MAGKKISQLEALESLTGVERFVVAKEDDNYQVQLGFVSNAIRQQINFQIILNNVNCKFTDLSEAITLKKSLFLYRGNNIAAIPVLSSQITGNYIDIMYVSSYYSTQVIITTQRLREGSNGIIEIGGTVTKTMLDTSVVTDSLTSNSTTNPLSAKQGKALKDMIDALPVPVYVVPFSISAATLLTQAQFDELDAAIKAGYVLMANVNQIYNPIISSVSDIGGIIELGLIQPGSGGATGYKIATYTLEVGSRIMPKYSGSLITSKEIVNNLTSTSSTTPLSANQGKVLKDMIDNLPAGGSSNVEIISVNWVSASGGYDASVPAGTYTKLIADGIREASYNKLIILHNTGAFVEAGHPEYTLVNSKTPTEEIGDPITLQIHELRQAATTVGLTLWDGSVWIKSDDTVSFIQGDGTITLETRGSYDSFLAADGSYASVPLLDKELVTGEISIAEPPTGTSRNGLDINFPVFDVANDSMSTLPINIPLTDSTQNGLMESSQYSWLDEVIARSDKETLCNIQSLLETINSRLTALEAK